VFSVLEYNIKVNVDLDNGLFVFDNESATGKTRLAKLLRSYRTYGEPVVSYTYDDFMLGLDLVSLLKPSVRLVIVDRYDLYNGYALLELAEFSKRSIVVIDCKYNFNPGIDFSWCSIDMQPTNIIIKEL